MQAMERKQSKKIGCPVKMTMTVYASNRDVAVVRIHGAHSHPTGDDVTDDDLKCRNLAPQMRRYRLSDGTIQFFDEPV